MSRDVYITKQIKNRKGRWQNIDYHGYLFGILLSMKYKIQTKGYHGLILVTGEVGDGKSTLVEGLSGLYNHLNDKTMTFDNIAWSTGSFIKKMDRTDNHDETLWWDEAIQGSGSRNMAMSAIGQKLKNNFVTKRFKRHLYFLVLDHLDEYSDRLISMADAWIHVDNFLLNRGRFVAYLNKNKIEYMYHLFKKEKKSWRSPEVRKVRPDCRGNFMNYEGIFLDPEEYNRLKSQETQQLQSQIIVDGDMIRAFYLFAKGYNKKQIGNQLGRPRTTINEWIARFNENMTTTESIVE